MSVAPPKAKNRYPMWMKGLGLFLSLCGSTGCMQPDGPPNILLVTIDTLRADHLAFYGYERSTMPHLEAWLDQAALFERCYSPLPLTDPSLASIFTGLYPLRHRVRHVGRRLPESFTSLTQILQANGYETAAFVSRQGLLDNGQFDRGFEFGNFRGGDAGGMTGPRAEAEIQQRRARDVTAEALAWLDRPTSGKPFFLWLHYFDPHAFYDPPEPFRSTFEPDREMETPANLRSWWGSVNNLGETLARYDGEILTTDHYLDQVIRKLKKHGQWDRTLFVLTSDHGESLGEHGHLDHGEWLYDEQIHVPLVMRYPGVIPAGARINDLVTLMDIAPSIIEISGIEGEDVADFLDHMDGVSLASLLRGVDAPSRHIFLESENCPEEKFSERKAPDMICFPAGVEGKARAYRGDRFKLIVSPRRSGRHYELYDLASDPGELENLADHHPSLVRKLESALDTHFKGRPIAEEIDLEMVEQLKALGYAR